MKLFPALKAVCYLSIGISISKWSELNYPVLFLLCFIFLIITLLNRKNQSNTLFLIAALITSGIISHSAFTTKSNFKSFQSTITGRICDFPHQQGRIISFPLKINEINGESLPFFPLKKRAWVQLKGCKREYSPGDLVRISGKFQSLRPKRNPGDYDLKTWRERNGYVGRMFTEIEPISISGKIPFHYKASSILYNLIEETFDQEKPYLHALLIGYRRDMDPEITQAFRRTGLSHLLAISGLHIGYLVVISFTISSFFHLSNFNKSLLSILIIIIFSLIVPSRPSTIRAVIMAIVFLAGPIFKRWSFSLNTLGVGALILLLVRPDDLFDVGFQLSFAAIGGIIMFKEEIQRFGRIKVIKGSKQNRLIQNYLVSPFLFSLSASIFIFPFLLFHFKFVNLLTPIYNIFAIPITGFIFCSAWVTILFTFSGVFVSDLFSGAVEGIIQILNGTVVLLSSVSPSLNFWIAPVSLFALIMVIFWSSFSGRTFVFRLFLSSLAMGFVLISSQLQSRPNRLQIWFLDVGQADASVWFFPEGYTVVVDGGNPSTSSELNPVVKILNHYGRSKIELLVGTHPDADHIGGFKDLIESFPIKLALKSSITSNTLIYNELDSIFCERNIDWNVAEAGHYISGFPGRYSIRVLNPFPEYKELRYSRNDMSLVIMLEIQHESGKVSKLLTTGDIEKTAERALINPCELKAELIKIAHHGSHTSSSDLFLEVVQPVNAVISHGGRYLRSVENTVSRLINNDIEVFTTYEEGAILFELSRNGWEKTNWRKPSFLIWFLGLA